MTLPVLLADVGDWVSVLIPLIVGIIWVLNQVFSNMAQRPNRPEVRRPGAPQPRQAQNPRVNEEIEKFLRRAAQQQQQQKRGEREPLAEPRPEPGRPAPRTLVQREAFQRPPTAPFSTPGSLVEVEMVNEEGPSVRGKSVDDHVEKYFKSSQFNTHATTPSRVEQADEARELRWHETFDRQLGSLTSTAAPLIPVDPPAPVQLGMATPASIAALLSDPRSVRNAIILQEILTRPESRWS